jgi:exonuclease SbcD
VVIAQIEPNNKAIVNAIELHTPKILIKKTCTSTNEAIEWLLQNQDKYVELTIESDTYMTPAEVKTLHQTHNGIIAIIPIVSVTKQENIETIIPSFSKPIDDLFEEYFMSKNNGQKPSNEIKRMFKRILAQEN